MRHVCSLFFERTDSQLEVVPGVCVDMCQCFLHGQSEQHQLAEVVPAVLALLNGRKRSKEGRKGRRRGEVEGRRGKGQV